VAAKWSKTEVVNSGSRWGVGLWAEKIRATRKLIDVTSIQISCNGRRDKKKRGGTRQVNERKNNNRCLPAR